MPLIETTALFLEYMLSARALRARAAVAANRVDVRTMIEVVVCKVKWRTAGEKKRSCCRAYRCSPGLDARLAFSFHLQQHCPCVYLARAAMRGDRDAATH